MVDLARAGRPRRRFRLQAEARMARFSDSEEYYNPLRRHSALEYGWPVVCEQETQPDPLPQPLFSQAPRPFTETGHPTS